MHSLPARVRWTAVLSAAATVLAAGVALALPAAATVSAGGGVVINEVESDDGKNPDWIELKNTSDAAVDISGWVVKDDDDSRTDAIPAGTTLAPGAYYLFTKPQMTFGLGKQDAARLFRSDGVTLVDSYSWTAHATVTYGRCPDGIGAFAQTTTATPGAANVCGTASPTPTPTSTSTLPSSGAVVVNEVESNGGDPDDWFELFNMTDAAIDLTGYEVRDDGDASDHRYELPSGSILPARGFLVVQKSVGSAPGFPFGLGSADMVRLFSPNHTTLIAQAAWTAHAATTFGRCPDGTGDFRDTAAATKGTANACGVPVAINEVESNGGTPDDWIELVNRSNAEVSVAGLVVTDSEITKNRYTIPVGTTIAAKGYLVLDKSSFGFGLGSADAVHLFADDGTTELDATSWTAHAATTWGRCPDVTGAFGETAASTKAAANSCAGDTTPVSSETWPGGASVRTVDAKNEYPDANLSGLAYADGGLWAVENGRGRLHRLVPQGDGWAQAPGWVDGKALHYPNGSGRVDAEAVAAVGGAVYVGSERDNDNNKVSRPAVLRYAPSASASTLIATAEWNLAADFPGLGANAGIEGLTWIPDSWLTSRGFVDASTGAAYTPSRYPGHGDGLFFVGVEGTAKVYAYALASSGAFSRVATIDTPFPVVAEVQYSFDRLWVVCDDACDGRIATYDIAASGTAHGTFQPTHVYARPAQTANFANEGFAIGDICTGGVVPTFYADDARTDGHSLRSGTLACTDAAPEPTATASPAPTGTASPTAGPSPTASATLAPTGGAAAPDPSQLTAATRGGVLGPASVVPGQAVTITVPSAAPGQAVHVWMFSTPTDLGAATVTAARTVTATIPASAPLGVHRIVVTDAAGSVLGWTEITVDASSLASTGGNAGGLPLLVIVAVLSLLIGAGIVRRRRDARGVLSIDQGPTA